LIDEKALTAYYLYMNSIQAAAQKQIGLIADVRSKLNSQKVLFGRKPNKENWLDTLESIYSLIIDEKKSEAAKLLRDFKDRGIVYQVPKEILNYLKS
jgi:hypothetical protein